MPDRTRKTRALKQLKRKLSPHVRRHTERKRFIRSPVMESVVGDHLKNYMHWHRVGHRSLDKLLDQDSFLRRLRRFNPSSVDPQFYDIKSLKDLGQKDVLDAIKENLLLQQIMEDKRGHLTPMDIARTLYISEDGAKDAVRKLIDGDLSEEKQDMFADYIRGVDLLHKEEDYMRNKRMIKNFLKRMRFTRTDIMNPEDDDMAYGFRMIRRNPHAYDEVWAKDMSTYIGAGGGGGTNNYTGAKRVPSRRILDERKRRIDTIYKIFYELADMDSEYAKDIFGDITSPDNWRTPPQYMDREYLQDYVRSMKRDLKIEKAARKKSRKPAKKKSRKPAKKKSRKPAKKKSRKPAKKKSRKPRQAPPSGVIKKENLPVGAVRVGADGKQKYVVYQVISRGKKIKKWKKVN